MSNVSSSANRSAKHSDPPEWHHDPDEDKITFRVWIRKMENKLDANEDHWATDRQRQGYIEGRLTGNIANTLAPYLEKDHPDQIKSSEELLKWLRNECDNPNKRIEAKTSYKQLFMKNTDSFLSFKNQFVGLAGEIHLPKAEWKVEIHDKLGKVPRLRSQLVGKYLDEFATFDDYCIYAQQVALDQKRTDDLRGETTTSGGRGGKNNNRGGNGPSSATPSSSSNPSARDQKADNKNTLTAAARAQRAGVSKDELIKRATDNLCYNCGKPGHQSRACPEGRRGMGNSGGGGSFEARRQARLNAIEEAFATAESNRDKYKASIEEDDQGSQGN